MNGKNIKKHLGAKVRDWVKHVDDEKVAKTIEENVVITGGAIVSLLTGEKVHDYDVYLRTKEACIEVAEYYIKKWNEKHPDKPVEVLYGEAMMKKFHFDEDNGAVRCIVASKGLASEDENNVSRVAYNFEDDVDLDEADGIPKETEDDEEEKKEKYRPRFISSNAISLSDKIQIVTRFCGDIETVHKNFDYAHCTCAWSSWDNKLSLPEKALECIVNKELYYMGSKYPLCSIIRSRKYIERGYHINAGQYVKMCMQLSEFDLSNVYVLEDQLTGVDTAYFNQLIDAVKTHMSDTGESGVDYLYVIDLINKLF